MSDFDMYILPLLCNQNEKLLLLVFNYNVKLIECICTKKMIRIYADIVQNPTFLGVSKLLEGSVAYIQYCAKVLGR